MSSVTERRTSKSALKFELVGQRPAFIGSSWQRFVFHMLHFPDVFLGKVPHNFLKNELVIGSKQKKADV